MCRESAMVVNIITDAQKEPNPEDANIIFTAKARAGLQKALNYNNVAQSIQVGEEMIKGCFAKHNIILTSTNLFALARHFNRGTVKGLYRAVADFVIPIQDVFDSYQRIHAEKLAKIKPVDKILPVVGIPDNMPVITTKCCMPVPVALFRGPYTLHSDRLFLNQGLFLPACAGGVTPLFAPF